MPTQLTGVEVRQGVRFFTATVEGVRYEIPEVWSIGYCTTHGGSAVEAAEEWHRQAVASQWTNAMAVLRASRVVEASR